MTHTLIHNSTLIDGRGGPPIPAAAVLLQDNQIVAAGVEADLVLPDVDIQRIDAGGGTILPGMIDTHVHVMFEGVKLDRDLVTPFSLRFYNTIQYLRRTLEAGITSVRDAGGADFGTKQALESGLIAGPRLQISVSMLSITGGHGDGWMLSGNRLNIFPSYPGMPDGICDGVDGVRKKVREVLRAGADIVKICSTGGVLSPTDHPEFTQFSPEELDVIVREASYRRGVKVMAHAQGTEGVKNAVRAGVHSIEHGIYLDDEACEMMVENGTFLVPTLLPVVYIIEHGEEAGLPEYGMRKSREVAEVHSQSIARAHRAGVKIAMGTDAGVMPHGTNLRELALMVGIGMTPIEAIVATTKTAAECLGWDDRLGTIEPGKLADILIAKTDPLLDIAWQNKDNIAVVIKDGKVVA